MIAFIESQSYESTVIKAVGMGGNSDTMACISGGIAAAYYGYIPDHILNECMH